MTYLLLNPHLPRRLVSRAIFGRAVRLQIGRGLEHRAPRGSFLENLGDTGTSRRFVFLGLGAESYRTFRVRGAAGLEDFAGVGSGLGVAR